MAVRFYGYAKCSTCRAAKKHLASLGVAFEDMEITTNPPGKTVLAAILKSGDHKLSDLFNRSGELYREMNMKDKLPKMSEAAALDLLSKHGMLIKRPIVTDGKRHTVGFKEEMFTKTWRPKV
jgi:arsenate reductase